MPNNTTIANYYTLKEQDKFTLLEEYIAQGQISESFLMDILATEKSNSLRWLAVKGLGVVRSKAATSRLIQLCKEPDENFDHTSLHAICTWSLGRIGISALNDVMELLKESDAETRRCAVDALGEIKHPIAVEKLAKALTDDEYSVKLWAGLSLAKIGDDALPNLHDIFSQSDNETKLIALDAILKIGSDKSTAFVRNSLMNGSSEEKKIVLAKGDKYHRMLLSEITVLADADDGDFSELAYLILRSHSPN